MPLFHFSCPNCGAHRRRILTPEAAKSEVPECPECFAAMERDAKPPSTRVVETLDNGLMPRRLERLADAERIYRDHAKKP